MITCSRCGVRGQLHSYPVGAGHAPVCSDCWLEVTGRPFLDVTYGHPQFAATFAGRMGAMRDRKAKIAANRLRMIEEAERNRERKGLATRF